MMSDQWWTSTSGPGLAQGDMLEQCRLPVFSFDEETGRPLVPVPTVKSRVIVVTQSCDLENDKVEFVALCPLHTIDEFEAANPEFKKKGKWEEVRKARVEGLYLLASPEKPDDNRSAFVVDFGHIFSVPLAYLRNHASSHGQRWRLRPPFLEHFSQGFARFFMRVGLPSAIPPYK